MTVHGFFPGPNTHLSIEPGTYVTGPRAPAFASSPLVVTLAGALLSGIDAEGVDWRVLALDGWDDADERLTLEEIPGAHGVFEPAPLYGARQITLEARAMARSQQARRVAEQRFKALTSSLRGVTLRVDEAPFARMATVWKAGKMNTVPTGPARVRFSLPLVAPDPTRYDVLPQQAPIALPSSVSSGVGFPLGFPMGFGGGASDVTVSNDGDATVWPSLYIPGPVVNPIVRNDTTGEQIELSITIADGDWLDIDPNPRARTVLLNGTANRRGSVVAGSTWPSLPPGLSTFQYRADTATTSTAVLQWRSGWT